MKHARIPAAALAACIASAAWHSAVAQAPDVTRLNLFRDFRGINDVGLAASDVLQYGGDVTGGSANVTIQGIFTSNQAGGSFTTGITPCGSFTVNPNFCARTSGFSVPRLDGTWQAKFTNANGSSTYTLPSAAVIPLDPVPFATDVTIATDAQGVPTLCWVIPPAAVVNEIRVNVYDKSSFNAQGVADIIQSANLAAAQTCFTPTVTLNVAGNYTLNLQLIRTRDGGPIQAGTGNANILSRSSSFFSFTRPANNPSAPVYLPQVSANGEFNFEVTNVPANTTIDIDPPVAVGYDYTTGPGDPNFRTVTLPNVGGGQFIVTYVANGQQFSIPLSAGTPHDFPTGGVPAFSVTGIDPAAGIDPGNAGAFVTKIGLVSQGPFKGRMVPRLSGNTLFAATLPTSRSIQVGGTATAFATIVNTGAAKSGCGLMPSTLTPATFSYQTTDPLTNQLTGSPNTPVSIPAGGSQSYVFGYNALSAMQPTDVALGYRCTSASGSEYVSTIIGVNSILLAFDANPVPDLIAVGLTPSNDGFSRTGGPSGTGVFAIASSNVGLGGQLTARARLSDPAMPATTLVCQTNPNTGACLSPPAPTATATVNQNETTTWSAFIQATGEILEDAARNRVFFEFLDTGGVVRGSTSTAVTTQ
jgi:hypothetical protein